MLKLSASFVATTRDRHRLDHHVRHHCRGHESPPSGQTGTETPDAELRVPRSELPAHSVEAASVPPDAEPLELPA